MIRIFSGNGCTISTNLLDAEAELERVFDAGRFEDLKFLNFCHLRE